MPVCYSCGAPFPEGKIYRTTLCSSCGKEAKVCLNCKFYQEGAHWDCRETISEPVRDKDKANFCDFFVPSNSVKDPGTGPKTQENAAEKLKKLFGD